MTDLLLEWMSFRRTGQIDDLPTALMNGSSARRTVNDLSILAHLDFMDEKSWRIAPPVLADVPGTTTEGSIAVLCGARTPAVLSNLAEACQEFGAKMVSNPVPGKLTKVCVISSKSGLESVANRARLAFQHNAAFTLLACIPTIRHWPRAPCSMVAGRVETVRRFSRRKVGWVETTLADATAAKKGFFRIKRDWDWVSLLKINISECAYIDDRAGRLLVSEKLRAVSWNAAEQILSLPIDLYPPRLISRALVLCTGELPNFDMTNRKIAFAGVSPEILRATLAITGLRLV